MKDERDEKENPRQSSMALMDSVVNTGDDFNGCNGSSGDVTWRCFLFTKNWIYISKRSKGVIYGYLIFISLVPTVANRFLG